jgi:hypothetical protein
VQRKIGTKNELECARKRKRGRERGRNGKRSKRGQVISENNMPTHLE